MAAAQTLNVSKSTEMQSVIYELMSVNAGRYNPDITAGVELGLKWNALLRILVSVRLSSQSPIRSAHWLVVDRLPLITSDQATGIFSVNRKV